MGDDIPWYSEASLRAQHHVFCAGSLAQCVRKWERLPEPEPERSASYLKLSHAIDGRMELGSEELAALAKQMGRV
jgi:hypothetical protein